MGTWTLKYPKNGYPYRVYSCFEYLMPSLLQMHLVTYWFTTSQWNAVERLEGRNFCQTMVGWKETLWRATSALGSYFLRTQFVLKFGFSEKATKIEKKIVILLTRASCSVRATAYFSKSWQRFFKRNVVKSYYTNFNYLVNKGESDSKIVTIYFHQPLDIEKIKTQMFFFVCLSNGFHENWQNHNKCLCFE